MTGSCSFRNRWFAITGTSFASFARSLINLMRFAGLMTDVKDSAKHIG